MGEVVSPRGEVEHRLMTAALSEERRGDEVKQLPLEGAQRHGHIAHIMWRVDRAVLLNDYLDSLDALTTDIVERIQQFWIQRIHHLRVLHSLRCATVGPSNSTCELQTKMSHEIS